MILVRFLFKRRSATDVTALKKHDKIYSYELHSVKSKPGNKGITLCKNALTNAIHCTLAINEKIQTQKYDLL